MVLDVIVIACALLCIIIGIGNWQYDHTIRCARALRCPPRRASVVGCYEFARNLASTYVSIRTYPLRPCYSSCLRTNYTHSVSRSYGHFLSTFYSALFVPTKKKVLSQKVLGNPPQREPVCRGGGGQSTFWWEYFVSPRVRHPQDLGGFRSSTRRTIFYRQPHL